MDSSWAWGRARGHVPAVIQQLSAKHCLCARDFSKHYFCSIEQEMKLLTGVDIPMERQTLHNQQVP